MADLDALLDEAVEVHFKVEPAVAKKRVDPPEVRPFLATTALVTPTSTRDLWSSYVRRDHNVAVQSKFLPSDNYQSGDNAPKTTAPNPNKILFEVSKAAAVKCGLNETKAVKISQLLNPATDSDVGKKLQVTYQKFLLDTLRKKVEEDLNYDPVKFPNLAKLYSK